MGTKEQYVKDFLKTAFPNVFKDKKLKEMKLLPSILSITADLIDIHNSQDNKKECEIVSVEYGEEKRLFCIYDSKHSKIYDFPENLPRELQINNKYYSKGQFSLIIEVEGFTIIQHYLENENQCGHSVESYEEILSTIFFFCPHILWAAMQKEFGASSLDASVIKAIHNCLAFYIMLEDIESDADGEVQKNKDQTLKEINNAKLMPQIENMVFYRTNDSIKSDGERLDHAVQIIQIGGVGIQVIREKLINTAIEKKKLKEVLGVKNYKKVLYYNENTFFSAEYD